MDHLPFLLSVGVILCFFFGIGFGAHRLRLPAVLLYILVGVAAAGLFAAQQWLHITAEIGIVLLFFILGLEFPLARMVGVSKRIWPAGTLDLAVNLGGALGLTLICGLDRGAALTLGSVAYATSSSITAKLLDENKRLASPEAEFILSLLIFEDLAAPILVSLIAATQAGDSLTAAGLAGLLGKVLGLSAGAVILGHFGFRRLHDFIGKCLQNDFMPLFAVGIALGYAGLALALGLSEILGAFLAGVMLSESRRSKELEHLLLPLRDLTLPFFFFWFGTTIEFGEGISRWGLLAGLAVLAVAGKMGTAYLGARWFGLSRKVSIRAACSMVQRGEFSAVIAGLSAPSLRIISGLYILITAVIGVVLFSRAPQIAAWDQGRRTPAGSSGAEPVTRSRTGG